MQRQEQMIKTTIRVPVELLWEVKKYARKMYGRGKFNEFTINAMCAMVNLQRNKEREEKEKIKKSMRVSILESEIEKLNVLIKNEQDPKQKEVLEGIKNGKFLESQKIRKEFFSNHLN